MQKNIFITTHIFPPEVHPSGIMNSELAKELSKNNYNVKVITCFPSHPKSELFTGWKRAILNIKRANGYDVIRSWHPIFKTNKIVGRIINIICQSFSFFIAAQSLERPNIIISDGPPILGTIISAIIAKMNKAVLITIIHDFVADIMLSNDILRKILGKQLLNIESFSYQLCDYIVVLSEGFRKIMIREKCIEESKIIIVPVWLDGQEIVPLERDNAWRREMNIPPEKFVVLYAGTIGLVSGAEVVLEAARLLEFYPDILFLLVGEGQAKDRLEEQVRYLRFPRVRFLPFQPRERLSEVQATADVSLVTLAPGRGKTSVPSKVLGYMAAARPVIAAVDVDCDTADTVRKAACGLVAKPGDGQELAHAILSFYQNNSHREACGQAGRRYFLQHFDRRVVMEKYLDLIERLAPPR
jgi:colanic acid biosynthesis glycosyl transferase WcaI